MNTGEPTGELPTLELIATVAAGTEAVVKRELAALGYDARTVTPGRLLFSGDADAICRTNLWLRSAERILIRIASFPASDFDALFDTTKSLAWEQWLPADAEFPVRGRSHHSQLSSVPACQRSVKRAIVERLRTAHRTQHLPETRPRYSIEISLRDDVATLTLDTTGVGLHKRGYRRLVGDAQLRETLAAAMVQLSFWRSGRVLADPFCGTGTIPIEAALIRRQHRAGFTSRIHFRVVAGTRPPPLAAGPRRSPRRHPSAAGRTIVGLRHRRRGAQPGPLPCGTSRRGRGYSLAAAPLQRAPRQSRVRLHRHQSSLWRADGRRSRDRRAVPVVPAGAAPVANLVALHSLVPRGPGRTRRPAGRSPPQAV